MSHKYSTANSVFPEVFDKIMARRQFILTQVIRVFPQLI
jgi:hypothetical protein